MKKLDSVADAVIEAYTKGGKSLHEIAATYSASPGTVRDLLITYGIARRSRGRRKATANTETATQSA